MRQLAMTGTGCLDRVAARTLVPHRYGRDAALAMPCVGGIRGTLFGDAQTQHYKQSAAVIAADADRLN